MKSRTKNFEIISKLGSGSYGIIFKTLNKATKEVCVLKQITLGRLSEKARRSAINEATIMGKLIHPYIVRYQQSFIEDNVLNIAMEYCDNGDLAGFLKAQNKKLLKEQKIWKFFIQICMGLQYIHRNKILHRDIKTLNIFLNKNEEVKIGDLGVAKMLTTNEFAQTMVGTPFYLSPQLCEEKPYNQKSDIWALGCLLYQLCTYQHPFEAQNQASLILKIIRGKYNPISDFYSKQLKDMIDTCLQRDYKRRPTASNILARPKIRELIELFKLDSNTVQPILSKAASKADEPRLQKETIPEMKKQIKVIDETKNEAVAVQLPQKVAQVSFEPRKKPQENVVQKQSKFQFVNNLQKIMQEQLKKQKKVGKHPSISFDIPWKDKINLAGAANPIVNQRSEEKLEKYNPITDSFKKPRLSVDNPVKSEQKTVDVRLMGKKDERPNQLRELNAKNSNQKIVVASKASVLPIKLPLPLASVAVQNKQKQVITKVKMEKNISPKVYESQKNVVKANAIIKSSGFTLGMEQQKEPAYLSKEKAQREEYRTEHKNPSIFIAARQDKVNKPEVKLVNVSGKQLFGDKQVEKLLSQNRLQSKNDSNALRRNVARVRNGTQNELSRQARNASRYNQISKQEQQMVMNLPNNQDSSDEEGQMQENSDNIKGKTNKSFRLKEINDKLVVQQYEDIVRGEVEDTSEAVDDQMEYSQQIIDEESEYVNNLGVEIQAEDESKEETYFKDEDQQIIREDLEDNIVSETRNQELEEIPQPESEVNGEVNYLQPPKPQQTQQGLEWQFDEEPELPLLQQREVAGAFEENNPYLVQVQQTLEDKKNHLQLKLTENMKREDEINKLMQIKIDQCKIFVPNQDSFMEILAFFRSKINMDSEYTEEDEKQVESFLRKKKLTDHRKFQNIYKIMHFQMQLQNTRRIIQRICKKLCQLQQSA